MKKFNRNLFVLFLAALLGGCAGFAQSSNEKATLMDHAPAKNCVSMGELSASAGAGSYQVEQLKKAAAQKGANVIVIKSQKGHFNKQISGIKVTTVVETFRCQK